MKSVFLVVVLVVRNVLSLFFPRGGISGEMMCILPDRDCVVAIQH